MTMINFGFGYTFVKYVFTMIWLSYAKQMITLRGVSMIVTFATLSLSYVICCHQFIFAAQSVKSRFVILNRNLRHYLRVVDSYTLFVRMSSAEVLQFIKKIALLHEQLSDAIDIINSTYTIEVLLQQTFAFKFIYKYIVLHVQIIPGFPVFTAFGTFRFSFQSNPNLSSITFLVNLSVCVLYNFYFIVIVYFGSSTRKEVLNNKLKKYEYNYFRYQFYFQGIKTGYISLSILNFSTDKEVTMKVREIC